jgi:hypothetical protein
VAPEMIGLDDTRIGGMKKARRVASVLKS